MIERTIDDQLKRVIEAIVHTTPELPPLGGAKRRGASPILGRAAAWGFAIAIALGGVAIILLPRGAPDPSTSTTAAAGTQPVTSDPGTETTEAGLDSRCSGQDPEIDEIPQMALPIGVADTRNALFASATTCDFASLDAIASQGSTPFDYGYQSADSPGAFWSALEDHGIRIMALLTNTLNRPYTVQGLGDGDIYVWPEPYEDGVGRLPWRPVVEIAEDGEWLSFVIPQQLELQLPDDLIPPTTAEATDARCDTVPEQPPGVSEMMASLFALAEAGEIGDTAPVFLGPAVAAVPTSMLQGLRYVGCSVEDLGGGLRFERMMWSDGVGYLMIFWQDWPKGAPDSGPPVAESASTTAVGDVLVTTGSQDLAGTNNNTVRFFDGDRALSLETYDLPALSQDAIAQIGWIVWTGLPTPGS